MRILVLSDFHGEFEVLSGLKDVVKREKPEIIVFCGDIVKGKARGDEWLEANATDRKPDSSLINIQLEHEDELYTYNKFFEAMNSFALPVLVIPGNIDAPEKLYTEVVKGIRQKLRNIHLIHKKTYRHLEVVFQGFGGEITKGRKEDFFVLMYPRDEVLKGLEKASNMILVLHSPPRASLVDLEGVRHRGSEAVNDILEELKPIACFCGHVHNAKGREKIGSTVVINPGAMKYGNYTVVDIKGKVIDAKFGNMRQTS